PVSVVAKQQTRRRLEDTRNTVKPLSELVVATKDVAGQRELNEAAQKKIQLAIVVVIEPDRARRPAGRREARFVGDIRERAIAIVVIQVASAIRRAEDVRI